MDNNKDNYNNNFHDNNRVQDQTQLGGGQSTGNSARD